jgi:hypothetical protein
MKSIPRVEQLKSLLYAPKVLLTETRAGILAFALGAVVAGVYGPAMISEAVSKPAAGASQVLPHAVEAVQVGTPNDDEGNPMPPIPARINTAAEAIARFEAERGIEVVGTLNDDEGNPMPAAPPRLMQFVAAASMPNSSDYRLEREGCCFGSDRIARMN